MKKSILIACAVLSMNGLLAQSNVTANVKTYETVMIAGIQQLDTASSAASMISIANNFERIGNAEKTKWEPFYYAAYTYVAMAYQSPDKSKIDWLADKAESLLNKAETIEHNNSEISCLKAMIVSSRIMVDPVGRFQEKIKDVHMLLGKSMTENVNNPRIYLLQARLLANTPEAFGGGKKPARETVKKAIEKFDAFKPATSISPNWGHKQAISLLSKLGSE